MTAISSQERTTTVGSPPSDLQSAPPERGSPQSSTGFNMTTSSQEGPQSTSPEKTRVDVLAQGSHSTSEDVKDGTVSGPSHAGNSDHSNGKVMDPNEKSSQPCEGLSTPSIKKPQEKPEVNQLPQKGLCSTEDAAEQKASDPAQVEDGQTTAPNREEGASQQMTNHKRDIEGKYEKEIQRLEAPVVDTGNQKSKEMQTKVELLEGKHEKEIQRLEALVVDTDNQKSKEIQTKVELLEGKHEKEIQRLEALIVDMGNQKSKEIQTKVELLEGKHEKEIQRLEALIVDTGNQKLKEVQTKVELLEGKHEKEIQRLEAIIVDMGKQKSEIEGLQTKVSSMEHIVNTEHKREIERLEGKHGKGIQRLEALIADMSKQVVKPEKETKRLQSKASSEERQARDPTRSPDEKPINSSQPLQAQATKHSSAAANQKSNGLDQESRIKKEQDKPLLTVSASGERTIIPLPPTVVPKADSLSVTDVANLVKALNAEIGQTVNLLAESLSDLGPPASDNGSEIAFDEVRHYLGRWLCDKLRGKSESDPVLITQLTLQTGLAKACSSVVNDSPFWCDGSILHQLYRRMAEKEGQTAANEWRAKASNYLDLPQCEDANKKYLTEVVLKLTTAAVGGTLQSSKSLGSQCKQQIEEIAKKAAKLHKTITEDVTSSELITYTVSCDTEFDASRMEDTENKRGSTPHGKVICTQDMGLLCRKRVEPKKSREPLKDWGVTMKAKVVLAATLEA